MHEWATNAAKYGVLGPLSGRLDVSWAQQGENVHLEWNETYDDPVEVHEGKSGFGSTLVQLSAAQLQGQVEVETGSYRRKMRLVYESEG